MLLWIILNNKNIREAASPLQTCAGHKAGAEAAIHETKTNLRRWFNGFVPTY